MSLALNSVKVLGLWIFKGLSGLALAYILATAGKELIGFGLFSFVFLMISITWAFLFLVRGLKYTGVLITVVCFGFVFLSIVFYMDHIHQQ